MVGGQTVLSMRCRYSPVGCGNNANCPQVIGAGGGQTVVSIMIRSENKLRPGNADLTRLEKSDLSRDFFSTEKIFYFFLDFR